MLALVSYQRVDLALQVFLLRLDGCRYLQAALWPLSVVLVCWKKDLFLLTPHDSMHEQSGRNLDYHHTHYH